ncbi:MAG: hypothetical protein ACD_62C00083G0011 [uncultured bacterium]|nr:MAG: hypothetical protein ACD_62C00083G0011 [uncultured bacterium]
MVLLGVASLSVAAENQQNPTADSSSCEELKNNLEQLVLVYDDYSHEAGKHRAWLDELRKDMDALTVSITKLAGGAVGLMALDQSKTCDQAVLAKDPKKLSNESKIACMNWALGEIQKKMEQTKRNITKLSDLLIKALNDIVEAQKRMVIAGCKIIEPQTPVQSQENPQEKTSQLVVDKSGEGTFEDLLYTLQEFADDTPDEGVFLGKWTGSAKVIKSNQPGAVGTSQPYVLEISKNDSGLTFTSSAGVIGKPEFYQTKFEGNHLRVDYSGPFETPGLPQVQTTLTFWIDVMLKNDALDGQMYVLSEATYEGKSTTKEMLLSVVLGRVK